MAQRFLVTGGAGFIGSAVVRMLIAHARDVLVVDKLTYAANIESLREAARSPRYRFLKADIGDRAAMDAALADFAPDVVLNLAAESHVDRSIDAPAIFLQTNVVGTFTLLQATLAHWRALPDAKRKVFRFQHISTDEVFGSLGREGLFDEDTPYRPNSPYSASKAASDHFVRAFGETYGLPVIITNCSNNYGPYHFPEKLIPLTILNALEGKPLPVYGKGDNVRDWLFVEDHARALLRVAEAGETGRTYAVGGRCERRNIDVVEAICALLDHHAPDPALGARRSLITFVTDRPGHDARYAIDCTRISTELGWTPQESFESGLEKTVRWYLANEWWWRPIREKVYGGERLGSG